MKYLEPDGDDTYKFTGEGKATEDERQKLIDIDESYVVLYGKHMITNYKEL